MTQPLDRNQEVMALVPVDDDVLAALVEAATLDAAADDVTPPVTAGSAWTAQRVEWLRSHHRDRRSGLDDVLGEATWAVVVDKQVVGAVRLKRADQQRLLETGLWLTRSVRGRGYGSAALAAVLRKARAWGASGVCADTTASNVAALALLRRMGFALERAEGGSGVQALLQLGDEEAP